VTIRDLPERRPTARWVLLLAGVLAAAVTATLWLYLARSDGVPAVTEVAAGGTGTSAGGMWRLRGLAATDSITSQWGTARPVKGATFIVATLDADLRAADPQATCSFTLVVKELWIREDTSVGDHPASVTCGRRGTDPVTVVFEVPALIVRDVKAVVVATAAGATLRLDGTVG
jgi:hypothetical protein